MRKSATERALASHHGTFDTRIGSPGFMIQRQVLGILEDRSGSIHALCIAYPPGTIAAFVRRALVGQLRIFATRRRIVEDFYAQFAG